MSEGELVFGRKGSGRSSRNLTPAALEKKKDSLRRYDVKQIIRSEMRKKATNGKGGGTGSRLAVFHTTLRDRLEEEPRGLHSQP